MLLPNKETERKELLSSKLSKMLEFQMEEDNFIDIGVSFTKSSSETEFVKGVPPIRLVFSG